VALIYLPDTNAWICYLRRKSPALVQRFRQADPADIRLCSVVLGELNYGVFHGPPSFRDHNAGLVLKLRQQFQSLPFDDSAAEDYGKTRADLAAKGSLIGPNDLIIASIALANGLTVVTHNTAEFRRVPGLTVEDWE
jgi:tRNA(fMet)-specific endonuclease VapC